MKTFILALATLVTVYAGGKRPEMEPASVISQEINSHEAGAYAAPMGPATVAIPLYRQTNIVVLDTPQYVLQLSEIGRSFIVLPVNGSVEFYRDHGYVVILDNRNKKHKFSIFGMTQK